MNKVSSEPLKRGHSLSQQITRSSSFVYLNNNKKLDFLKSANKHSCYSCHVLQPALKTSNWTCHYTKTQK